MTDIKAGGWAKFKGGKYPGRPVFVDEIRYDSSNTKGKGWECHEYDTYKGHWIDADELEPIEQPFEIHVFIRMHPSVSHHMRQWAATWRKTGTDTWETEMHYVMVPQRVTVKLEESALVNGLPDWIVSYEVLSHA